MIWIYRIGIFIKTVILFLLLKKLNESYFEKRHAKFFYFVTTNSQLKWEILMLSQVFLMTSFLEISILWIKNLTRVGEPDMKKSPSAQQKDLEGIIVSLLYIV